MFEGATLEYEGDVFVDSGLIAITDPCTAGEIREADWQGPNAPMAVVTSDGHTAATITPTATGDGIYEVFRVMVDGNPVGIYVDFTGDLADVDMPGDTPARPALIG